MLLKARWRCRSHVAGLARMEVDHKQPVKTWWFRTQWKNLQALCRSVSLFRKTRQENRRELTPDEVRWRELLVADDGAPAVNAERGKDERKRVEVETAKQYCDVTGPDLSTLVTVRIG